MELINITVTDGKEIVNARDLHAFLGSKRMFANWIRQRIEQYGFEEGVDFRFNKFVKPIAAGKRGNETTIEYRLSVNMAKELAMGENNAKGKQARQYFIAREEQAKRLERELVVGLSLRMDKLDGSVSAITKSESSDCFRDAAKIIGVKETFLIDLLLKKKWLYRRPSNGRLAAFAKPVQRGFIEEKYTTLDTGTEVVSKTLLLPKGILEIRKMIDATKEK